MTNIKLHSLAKPLKHSLYEKKSKVHNLGSFLPIILVTFWVFDTHFSVAAPLYSFLWMIYDDLNIILSPEDKIDDHPFSLTSSIIDIKIFIFKMSLVDLGFLGPHFMKSNKCFGKNYIMACFDRALANAYWLSIFYDILISHLSRIYSDHPSLLIKSHTN